MFLKLQGLGPGLGPFYPNLLRFWDSPAVPCTLRVGLGPRPGGWPSSLVILAIWLLSAQLALGATTIFPFMHKEAGLMPTSLRLTWDGPQSFEQS